MQTNNQRASFEKLEKRIDELQTIAHFEKIEAARQQQKMEHI